MADYLEYICNVCKRKVEYSKYRYNVISVTIGITKNLKNYQKEWVEHII